MSREELTDDEVKLLLYFRNMDKRSQKLFLHMGEYEANRTKKEKDDECKQH